MRNTTPIFTILLIISILVGGCNFDRQETTPTAEGVEEPINPLPQVADVSPTPSPSPSPTMTTAVELTSPTPTITPVPSETPTPTETPGPWEYVIQPNDILGSIIQQPPFNYDYDLAVIDAVVRLNDNIPNADQLPPPGTTILIPRPTPIPTIASAEITVSPNAVTPVVQMRDNVAIPTYAITGLHTVKAGESAVGIIEQYGGMTLEIFSMLNASINFSGCNFELPSGGPNCNPFLREGQQVNVLLPTPTLTLTPTPSGSETPTPTPPYNAPMLLSPLEGVLRGGPLHLQWATVGVLEPEEVYLVQVRDQTAAESRWNGITKETSIRIPDQMIPTDGQTHTIEWTVAVAVRNEQGQYVPVGEMSPTRTFQWQSR